MIAETQHSRIFGFQQHMIESEKSPATVAKYSYEAEEFLCFLDGRSPDKCIVIEYREYLQSKFKAATVNGKLSALNAYLAYIGASEFRVKFLKLQRAAYINESRELTEAEYRRLLSAANSVNNERLYMVMMTICSTGIRVSELRYITVEALKRGSAAIRLKGKNRTVILPRGLKKRLNEYAKKRGIRDGVIFRTRTGNPIDRSNICHEMKKLCAAAKVESSKVFPHNLRHLFARSFYSIEKDIAHLADILGHSSIETTRIYIAASVRTHEKVIDKMRLIL